MVAVKVLVTGGAGYVGSTVATALIAAGHVPVILDSFLTGPRAFVAGRTWYEGDVADRAVLVRILADHPDVACAIHLAARTVVSESVMDPLGYYDANVARSLLLFGHLAELGIERVVFSSSASVYGTSGSFELDESAPLDPASPYARSKAMTEQVLADLAAAGVLRGLALRYFNPIGSDPDLTTGVYAESPTHVVGQLVRVAQGWLPAFRITGTDFDTPDGTGLRDYVHVWDVARAHVDAVERFDAALDVLGTPSGVVNLGTGTGTTVRQLLAGFERVIGRSLPVVEEPARPGDPSGGYANVRRAQDVLGWRARSTVDDALRSAWGWGNKRRSVLGYD